MSTWINDLKNSITRKDSFVPAVRTTSGEGEGVDLQEAEGNVFASIHVGAVSGTNPTLDVKMQESDDDVTYSDIVGAVFAQITLANQVADLTFKRAKRFVKAVATIAGTTPSFASAVSVASMLKTKT